MRPLVQISLLFLLLAAGVVGFGYLQHRFSSEARIKELEAQQKQLEDFVQRLGSERRVAEAMVTDQKNVDGKLQTTILFVEYARDGSTLPPRTFTVEGDGVHIEAMVIKFEQESVARDDPLRGHSIALFTRLFGDNQSPADAFPIDQPGSIPDVYRGATPAQVNFEEQLWQQFWKLADDPDYAKSQGVRLAQGQGVWRHLIPGYVYKLTTEANGGLNMEAIKMQGAVSEYLKEKMGGTTQPN